MGNSRLRIWRMSLPLMICLLVGGSIFTLPFAQPAAAATDGYSISNGAPPSTRPSMAVSPDNSKICSTWTTFNQNPDQTYIRIYTIANGSWSPDLSQNPFNVARSAGGSAAGNSARCAIDGAGRTHVVWTENSGGRLRYSMLAANADAGNSGNWTDPIDITAGGAGGDGQNPDVVSLFADASGNVYLAYWSLDNNGVFVRNWVNNSGWSGATKVSASGGKHPRIGVDNAGYVHVVYQQSGAGMRYSYRDAATGQWNIDNSVPGAGNLIEQSGLAVDRDNGDVHIVFTAQLGGDDNTRVVRYVKKTGRTGTNFSGVTDLTGQGNHVVARIAWSPAGKLTVVSDKRDARVITIATSNNNGASWSGASDLTSGNGGQWPSVAMDAAGNSYVTYWTGEQINFVQLGSATPAPTTRFADVPTSYWAYAQIESFAAKGRTTGCGDDVQGRRLYCPDNDVTRAEMAVFITRTLGEDQTSATGQTFADVPPTYWAYRQIERFAQLGITTGCGVNESGQRIYCPDNDVTRAEMAVFLERAYP